MLKKLIKPLKTEKKEKEKIIENVIGFSCFL